MHGLFRGPGPAVCSPGGGVPPDPPFNPGPDPIQGCQVLQGGRDTHGLCPLTHVSHDPRGLLMAGLLKRGLRFPLWRVSRCRIMTPGQHLAAGTSMMHCLSGSSTTVRYCTQYCSETLYSVLQWDTVFSTAVRHCIQYCSEILYSVLQWDTVFSTASEILYSVQLVRYCIQYCSEKLCSVLQWDTVLLCDTVFSTVVRYCIQYCWEILYSVLLWDTVFSTASEILYSVLQWDTVLLVRYCIQYC